MQTYELLVRNRAVLPNSEDTTLVRTSIGIDKVHVLFDNPEWEDFPITVTFANGGTRVSQSLTVSALGGDEWALEGECVVPWEVVQDVGSIRVTFQGTDSQGNHIITAAGAPLSVEEAGDVEMGDVPDGAPTVDQWNQAYADAVAAANQLATKLAECDAALAAMSEAALPIATVESVGAVRPDGETVTVDEDGSIHAASAYELPIATTGELGGVMVDGETIEADAYGTVSIVENIRNAIANLRRLASTAFDTTFDGDGNLESATPKPATASTVGGVKPDGTTVTVDEDGTLSARAAAGQGLFAEDDGSLSVGVEYTVDGTAPHAEGAYNTATGDYSHAEGESTTASAAAAHAEGYGSTASGDYSHAEGERAIASGESSHAEGMNTEATAATAHAEGMNAEATATAAHAEGTSSEATSGAAHAEGSGAKAGGAASHAEGRLSTASADYSHAEGNGTTASGQSSHAEGNGAKATQAASHAEGAGSEANSYASHAEGSGTKANGMGSHAEGMNATAGGDQSHAEGMNSTATGVACHSEGNGSSAGGTACHSEGMSTTAAGTGSHAEGMGSSAKGAAAHADGQYTSAVGSCARASGLYTRAYSGSLPQAVLGRFNVPDATYDEGSDAWTPNDTYLVIVGNGTNDANRSNALTLDAAGNLAISGVLDFTGMVDGTTVKVDSNGKLYVDVAEVAAAMNS